jgi:hypothetical protein
MEALHTVLLICSPDVLPAMSKARSFNARADGDGKQPGACPGTAVVHLRQEAEAGARDAGV